MVNDVLQLFALLWPSMVWRFGGEECKQYLSKKNLVRDFRDVVIVVDWASESKS